MGRRTPQGQNETILDRSGSLGRTQARRRLCREVEKEDGKEAKGVRKKDQKSETKQQGEILAESWATSTQGRDVVAPGRRAIA